MKVCAVIVAGGRSSRMGREKAFETVRGQTILQRVVTCVAGQVQRVIINSNGDAARFGATSLCVIHDIRKDIGSPLAGLHAALAYANRENFDAVLTVPSDAPFLPQDLAARLQHAGREAAIAASGGQAHYLTGLWAPELLPRIEQAMQQESLPRLQDWVRHCDAAVVDWPIVPYDPFLNVNTPAELAEAERIAAEFSL